MPFPARFFVISWFSPSFRPASTLPTPKTNHGSRHAEVGTDRHRWQFSDLGPPTSDLGPRLRTRCEPFSVCKGHFGGIFGLLRPRSAPRRVRSAGIPFAASLPVTACGGRRFLGHSAGRALRLTWGAACSAQQPRRTARKSPKTALKPSFPHCGNIFSIVWKNGEKFFHCVEKSPKLFPLRGKLHVINPSRPMMIVRMTYKIGMIRVVEERRELGLIAIIGRRWYMELGCR